MLSGQNKQPRSLLCELLAEIPEGFTVAFYQKDMFFVRVAGPKGDDRIVEKTEIEPSIMLTDRAELAVHSALTSTLERARVRLAAADSG